MGQICINNIKQYIRTNSADNLLDMLDKVQQMKQLSVDADAIFDGDFLGEML